jgi:hypothetical protein
MIKTLKRAVGAWPEPKRVTVKTWRDDATNGRVSLNAQQRINVAHPKARFAALDPHTPYTAWVHPGRVVTGLLWVGAVAGLAVYGLKTGRGPLQDVYGWAPFSAQDDSR